jgi:hypothetical protein
MKQLDQETFQRVTLIINRARRSGANVPTRLHEAGLLWTPERQKKLARDTVQDMIAEFDVWRPAEFLRLIKRELVNCTPTDMHMAIRQWIGDYADHVRR